MSPFRSLDEPLHLHILTSLASNLAQSPPDVPHGHRVAAGAPETSSANQYDIHVISKGLPSDGIPGRAVSISLNGDDEEDEGWVSSAGAEVGCES